MSVARPREDRRALGVGFMCGAVLFFTSIDTSAKWLMLAGLPPLQVVFVRYAGHFLLSLATVAPSEGAAALRSSRPLLQLLRSALLLGSTAFNFVALIWLPLTVTTTINFAMPIAVSLLSIPILGERVGPRRLAAVVVGFFGVLVVVQPWGTAFHPAMLLSLGTLTCGSLYFVLTRLLAGQETNLVSQLWPSGLGTMALAPFAIGAWVWPETPLGWAVMLAIGGFGMAGHSSANIAHRFADASLLAPVVYLQLLFATLASVLVFGAFPSAWTLLGAAIIVGSGIYIWRRERRAPPRR